MVQILLVLVSRLPSYYLSFTSKQCCIDRALFGQWACLCMDVCVFKVAKIEIGYAKTAKKMDVKKLKTAIWSVLTTDQKEDKVRA